MCRHRPSVPRRLELPDAAQLHGLVLLRRVRDRLDRECAQPFDAPSLARDVHLTPRQLTREFELAFGQSPYAYVLSRRAERAPLDPRTTIGNREASTVEADSALRS